MTRSHSAPEPGRVSKVGWSSVTNDHSRRRRVTAAWPCVPIVSYSTSRDTLPIVVESGSFHPGSIHRRAESPNPRCDSSSRSPRSGWSQTPVGAAARRSGPRARTEWSSAHPGRPRGRSRTAPMGHRPGRADRRGAVHTGRTLRRPPDPADTRASGTSLLNARLAGPRIRHRTPHESAAQRRAAREWARARETTAPPKDACPGSRSQPRLVFEPLVRGSTSKVSGSSTAPGAERGSAVARAKSRAA